MSSILTDEERQKILSLYASGSLYDLSVAIERAVSEKTKNNLKVEREESGIKDFIENLIRSREKYPNNRCMYDGLIGEVEELRRAYLGDGDIRLEALDVAVVAFRIAIDGDSGGNELIPKLIADDDFIEVPRSLLGAACYTINKKGEATTLLEELRKYTTGKYSKGRYSTGSPRTAGSLGVQINHD